MHAAGKCVTGMERKKNEDAIFVSDGTGCLEQLYIVADGIGGHAGGEVASNGAIDAFLSYVENHCAATGEELLDVLVGAVQYANSNIYHRSLMEEAHQGMGTTFTAVALQGESLYGVHIGDSRLYRFRKGILTQLSRDHSYVMEMVRQGKLTEEEARNHPKRNIITKALGIRQVAEPDTLIDRFLPEDTLLLCSDGLSSMLTGDEIAFVLRNHPSPQEAVDRLVDMANENGGLDNISVIVIEQGR